MKRITFILLITGLFVSVNGHTEETNAVAPAKDASAPSAASTPAAPPAAPVPAVETTTPPAIVAAPPATAPAVENANADNLEFISGEVGELDEAGKTLTVKLYGEAEAATTDKTLKVSVDANTDITDGEQDRDFKSLSVGTEVDVEYDPATNKATYIFVY